MALTPKDIATKRFSAPIIGRRAYREDEVRAFLHRAAATLRGRDNLTSLEVGRAAFSKPKRNELGYSEDEVAAFLGLVAVELTRYFKTRRG